MIRKLFMNGCVLSAAVFIVGCTKTTPTTNVNLSTNSNSAESSSNETAAANESVTRPGPDNSEITTSVDAGGIKTETRVFKRNRRVDRVIVTTRQDSRTVHVYSRSGRVKELPQDKSQGGVLNQTGDAIADAAGFVEEKSSEVAKKTGEETKNVKEKTEEATKNVAEKTAETAKKVGEKSKEGAKKTGKAIKKVVNP